MPFLRFTRDKRGYETTAVVHAFRGRHGRTRQKLLYWFRTPPGVKVGRPALDEEAIRWIEEHNPEIDFDWQKILASTPAPAPAEDGKARRGRQRQTERRAQGGQMPAPPRRPQPEPVLPAAVPPAAEPDDTSQKGAGLLFDRLDSNMSPASFQAAEEADLPDPDAEFDDEGEAPEQEALEQVTHPDAEEVPRGTLPAIEKLAGREQVLRLRARYAELQARITERGGDAAHIEELRAKAERLNPDSWVTVEDARKGLQEFEPAIRDLRAALGLRRRRRSRRGGRRRRPSAPASAPTVETVDSNGASPDINSRDSES